MCGPMCGWGGALRMRDAATEDPNAISGVRATVVYRNPLARNTLWCCRGRGLALLAVIRLGHICFTHVAHGSCGGVTQRQLRISS